MGIRVSLIKQTVQKLGKINPRELRYVTEPMPMLKAVPAGDVVNLTKKAFSKSEVLTKYCAEKGYNFDLALKEFEQAEKYLDAESIQRLLKLTDEGKILLMDKPKIRLKKKIFSFAGLESSDKTTVLSRLRPLENDVTGELINPEESAKALKTLLEFETTGKIPAEKITSVLKMQEMVAPEEFNTLIKAIESGQVNSKNISQAIVMTENYIPIKLLNAKSLNELSREELKELNSILAAKGSNRNAAKAATEQSFRDKICELDTPLLPKSYEARSKLVVEISKKLTALTKVNAVPKEISSHFIVNFENTAKALGSAKHSIDDLVKAGGIQLSYPREVLKTNIFKQIEHLPKIEQQKILEKFGLNEVAKGIVNGLPVYIKNPQGACETAINNEIGKFLNSNKIILPKGFEEYQAPLDEICRTFPEFLYTIGSKQHGTHSKNLSEHILMAFQENMRNPLYKNLNASDRKVLGISTILHDINKTEMTVDAIHPLVSSKTANAIVQRMGDLSVSEKNRIINFIENHHWLMKIKDGAVFDEVVVKDLAYKFRSGNDFEMAKIFAESDLKAVNSQFFPKYGGKINTPMTKAIEEEIINIQSKGRAIYTADITADTAVKMGAKTTAIGEGAETTHNIVASAKQLGLDTQNVLYHAPGKDDGFLLAQSCFGYGNEGVLSCTLGRNRHSAVFQGRKEFFGFRRPDMNKISVTSKNNANLGIEKEYRHEREWLMKSENFSKGVKKQYSELSSKPISDKDYALIFREIQTLENPNLIHSNKTVQRILGGETEAKMFEKAIIDNNEIFVATSKNAPKGEWRFSELVASDLEVGFIGTNRKPEEVSFAVRKLAEENHWPIVYFD